MRLHLEARHPGAPGYFEAAVFTCLSILFIGLSYKTAAKLQHDPAFFPLAIGSLVVAVAIVRWPSVGIGMGLIASMVLVLFAIRALQWTVERSGKEHEFGIVFWFIYGTVPMTLVVGASLGWAARMAAVSRRPELGPGLLLGALSFLVMAAVLWIPWVYFLGPLRWPCFARIMDCRPLGLAERERGHYEAASRVFERSCRVEKMPGAMVACISLLDVASMTGRAQQAIDLVGPRCTEWGVSEGCRRIGELQLKVGKWGDAEPWFTQSCQVLLRPNVPRGPNNTCQSTVEIAIEQGQLSDAVRLYELDCEAKAHTPCEPHNGIAGFLFYEGWNKATPERFRAHRKWFEQECIAGAAGACLAMGNFEWNWGYRVQAPGWWGRCCSQGLQACCVNLRTNR